MLSVVGAGDSLIKGDVRGSEKGFPESGGFPRLPEQSTERKQLVSVMKVVILILAMTDYKVQISCGRAWKPAPTDFSKILIVFAAERQHNP